MQKSPFIEHLIELRKRLMVACLVTVVGMGVAYFFKEHVFYFLTSPLTENTNAPQTLIFTGVPELFFTYLKMSFFCGLFVGLPIILWEIWSFIAPGLYDHERRVVGPFIAVTPLLFYAGGAFMYYIVLPLAMDFFLMFQTENITALPSVKEYLAFLIKMLFAFGLAFELPVLLLLLMKFGVVSLQTIKGFRRYAIVFIFIASALLTPSDPMSQVVLALPLVILYELSILMAKFMRIGEKVEKEAV